MNNPFPFWLPGQKYEGVRFKRGNCGVSIMRSGPSHFTLPQLSDTLIYKHKPVFRILVWHYVSVTHKQVKRWSKAYGTVADPSASARFLYRPMRRRWKLKYTTQSSHRIFTDAESCLCILSWVSAQWTNFDCRPQFCANVCIPYGFWMKKERCISSLHCINKKTWSSWSSV